MAWQPSSGTGCRALRNFAAITSADLLAELEDVLHRPKFVQRLSRANVNPRLLIVGYAALARLVEPMSIEPVIIEDPDDDMVLACAVAARGEVIVSGDSHLLDLDQYEGIPILTAAQLLAQLEQQRSGGS